ncbi:MAG: septation protein IspZ [Oligoflexia bacterium]|nr:septation protein IspZ [Oligoflexia bacterium]
MRFPASWRQIETWRNWAGWIALNFAAPIGFFWTFRTFGARPAILLAVVLTLGQVIFHRIYDIRFSPFFLVASGFTLVFGSIDLLSLAEPRFFRLAPFAQNFLLGTAFLGTLLTRAPAIAWFAAALPRELRPDPALIEQGYLRRVTLVWGLYFLAKAALFLYLGLNVDLGVLILLRSIIGGGSLTLMFLAELAYRKWLRPRRARRRAPRAV